MATFKGNNSSNNLNGTSGTDYMYGYGGNDVIHGNDGNDTLYGGDGNDRFFSADNLSFLEKYWGCNGADKMYGGKGNDLYLVENSGDKVIEYKNEGYDTVYSKITYTLPPNVESGYLIIAGEKSLYGNELNNMLCGNCYANKLFGYNGNDTIFGGGYGKDLINGGNGDDWMKASRRDCQIYGDEGNDTLVGWYGNDTLYGGSGNDYYRGFIKQTENLSTGKFSGFGKDIIKDYMDYGHTASKSYGDKLDLTSFNLSSAKFSAVDLNHNGRIDGLLINCNSYGSLTIDKYFNDGSRYAESSSAGIGCIEDIVLSSNKHLYFDDIQQLV